MMKPELETVTWGASGSLIYVTVRKGVWHHTEHIDDTPKGDVVIDYDEAGNVLGFEIL